MLSAADHPEASVAIRVDLGAIFVSMELGKSTWLITSLSPGGGEKMSRHAVTGGDIAGLFARFGELRKKAQARTGKCYPLVVIQEAGLDGFWIDRGAAPGRLDRKPCRRCRFDCRLASASLCEDRPDRRRDAGPHTDGLQARRAPCLLDGQGAIPPRRKIVAASAASARRWSPSGCFT